MYKFNVNCSYTGEGSLAVKINLNVYFHITLGLSYFE